MPEGGYSQVYWSIKDSLQGSTAVSLGLWVYLISSAAVSRKSTPAGHVIERGQVWVSLRDLEKRLSVSRSTIGRHLQLWERDGAIEVQKLGRNGTIITLCNFDTYQPLGRDGGTKASQKPAKSGPQRDRNRTHTESPKSPKSPKNQEQGADAPSVSLDVIEDQQVRESVGTWLDYKRERRESYKPKGLEALLKRVNKLAREHGAEAVCDAIEKAMSSNWQGFDHDFGKPASPTRGSPATPPRRSLLEDLESVPST